LSGLVAASLLLGQNGQVQVIGPMQASGGTYTGGTVQQQLSLTPPVEMPPPPRPFLNRVRSWFGRDNSQPTGMPAQGTTVNTEPRPATPYITPPPSGGSDYPRRMPAINSAAPVPAGQPVAVGSGPVSTNPSEFAASLRKTPLRPALANKVGRDDKFAWITGQLEIENGTYVIYYATPETIDPHNGRLVLAPQIDMKQFRPGDLITVEGQVQTRASLRGNTASYRVVNAGVVEKSDK
jgi:hypothetical protein